MLSTTKRQRTVRDPSFLAHNHVFCKSVIVTVWKLDTSGHEFDVTYG